MPAHAHSHPCLKLQTEKLSPLREPVVASELFKLLLFQSEYTCCIYRCSSWSVYTSTIPFLFISIAM